MNKITKDLQKELGLKTDVEIRKDKVLQKAMRFDQAPCVPLLAKTIYKEYPLAPFFNYVSGHEKSDDSDEEDKNPSDLSPLNCTVLSNLSEYGNNEIRHLTGKSNIKGKGYLGGVKWTLN